MKADRYTRAILTVIAVSLLWIAIQLTSPVKTATAAFEAGEAPVEVNIVGVGGHKFSVLDVSVVDVVLPVKIKN
ncbi:MAG: hypothetical protein ABFS14_09950 [Gemmatimonadota bacterium]